MTRNMLIVLAVVVMMGTGMVGCGPTVKYTPDDPSDVRSSRSPEDVTLLEMGDTPGPGYRTIGTVEISSEVSCNTAMSQSKESAKGVIDEYVKNNMELADSTSQEVVEAMVESGDLSKSQACKVLPIYSQIPEKEDILIAILKNNNLKALVEGTAHAGGDGLYEVEHEIFKTRKKPALSGAGAVSPSLVVNIKSKGKVITFKEEEKKEEEEEKKPEEKKSSEEVVVVKKATPPPVEKKEEEEEEEEKLVVAKAEPPEEAKKPKKPKKPKKKTETLLVKKEVIAKKEEPPPPKKEEPKPEPVKKAEEEPADEDLDPKAAAQKAKREAEEAMKALKEAKKKAKEAKLKAEQLELEKKKAAMKKKKEEAAAKKKAEAEAKKAAIAAKKKAAAEEAAKKKAAAKEKKKAEEEKKKPDEDVKLEVKKADAETIDNAKNIIRGWKKEIFECLHKSEIIESSGKVSLTFFIDSQGVLDALNISPEPESTINPCIMKTVGDLDFPELGANYEFLMKYKIKPD